MNTRFAALAAGAALASAAMFGCQATDPSTTANPSVEQVAQMTESNVVGVVAYYDPYNPWIWNENKTRVQGIVVGALYLAGPNSKGVFGDGVIKPRMYARYVNDQGEADWKLVKEWSFTADQSVLYRAKKQTWQGWGYRFHLPFENVQVAGREIRMVVEYQRSDGGVVYSGKKDFKVPRLTST